MVQEMLSAFHGRTSSGSSRWVGNKRLQNTLMEQVVSKGVNEWHQFMRKKLKISQ